MLQGSSDGRRKKRFYDRHGSHGVSRYGAIHQLFGRALFPSFLAEFLRLQTKSGKTEDVAQTPPERRWGLPLAR